MVCFSFMLQAVPIILAWQAFLNSSFVWDQPVNDNDEKVVYETAYRYNLCSGSPTLFGLVMTSDQPSEEDGLCRAMLLYSSYALRVFSGAVTFLLASRLLFELGQVADFCFGH